MLAASMDLKNPYRNFWVPGEFTVLRGESVLSRRTRGLGFFLVPEEEEV